MPVTNSEVKIMVNRLNLYKTGWWAETRMRQAVRSFFQQLLRAETQCDFMLLRVQFPCSLTTQAIIDMLETYSVFGVCGQVDPRQEWEFCLPTENFALADEILEVQQVMAGYERKMATEGELTVLELIQLGERPWRIAYFVGGPVGLLAPDDEDNMSNQENRPH